MPKAYWVAHVDVDDPETYEEYKSANAVAFAKYGAKFIIRGGQQEVCEGKNRTRTVVLEFQNYKMALACYNSPEYKKALAIRKDIATSDLLIVEGV